MDTQADTRAEPDAIALPEAAAAEMQRIIDEHGAELAQPAVRISVQGTARRREYALDLRSMTRCARSSTRRWG